MSVLRPQPNGAVSSFVHSDEQGKIIFAGLMAWIEFWLDGAEEDALRAGDTDFDKGRVDAFRQVLRDLPTVTRQSQ